MKFNPPQASATTSSGNTTTTTKEANLDNDSDQEDVILWERANDILQNVLSDDCHAVERLFRPAGRFEDAHREAGLTRWFVYDCSTNNSTTNTTQDPPEEHGDDSGTQATETSGHMAVSALTKLQEWFDHIDDPNQDSVWSMEFVTAEHKVEETVLAGSRQDIPISTRDQALETGPTGLSTSTTSAIPNDPLLSFQDHYDAIQLPAAWQIMTDSNAWPQCKNVVVQVLDSGWDTDHVDSGGMFVPHPIGLADCLLSSLCNTYGDSSRLAFALLLQSINGPIQARTVREPAVAMVSTMTTMVLWTTVMDTIMAIEPRPISLGVAIMEVIAPVPLVRPPTMIWVSLEWQEDEEIIRVFPF